MSEAQRWTDCAGMSDAIVVGAGIAGLAAAWRLAQTGRKVTVVDRGAPAGDATGAAAGYIQAAPADRTSSAMTKSACAIWPKFAQELQVETGISIDFRSDGALFIAAADEEEYLQIRYDQRQELGEAVERLTAQQAREREPQLGPENIGAVFSPAVSWVDPMLTCRALIQAIEKSGGNVRSNAPVENVRIANDRIAGVVLEDQARLDGDIVVIAAGLLGGFGTAPILGPGWQHPRTRAVKGHMLSLAGPAEQLVQGLLIRRQGCILPRADGRIFIGVTRELSGLDRSVDPETIAMLHENAVQYVPALRNLPIARSWSGLRPYPADGLAMIGETAVSGLYLINGLGPSGVMLSTFAADAIVAAVSGGQIHPEALRYSPMRFSKPKETV